MDCSPPGSSVHGILQARMLEWVAISFFRGSSRPMNQTQVSCIASRFFTDWAMREAPGPNVKISKPHSKALELALKAFSLSAWLGSLLYFCEFDLFLLRERNRLVLDQLQVAWVQFRKEKALCLCTILHEVQILKHKRRASIYTTVLSFPKIGFSRWCSSSRWQQSLLPESDNLGSSSFASACANAGDIRAVGPIPGWWISPGEGIATHFNLLAWRILWTEEPGGLQSIGLQSQTRLKWLSTHAHVSLHNTYLYSNSVLAWRIPGMEEPGGLPSVESHRVGHGWSDLAVAVPIVKANLVSRTQICKVKGSCKS